jgi:hypothetical protein
MREPLERYLEWFDRLRADVERLLVALGDLEPARQAPAAVHAVMADGGLLDALRYLAGPPVSADDLKVVTESSLAPGRLRAAPAEAEAVFQTVLNGLDRRRFPWVVEGRPASAAERSAALTATAALMATQRLATSRRNESKTLQEEQAFRALQGIGFERVPTRTIRTLDDAPAAGQFCAESMLGGRKADIVVRLRDRRVLAIEGKVSNSSTNTIKRLNNDAAVKAVAWLHEFGVRQLVPSAMLSGVFKLTNLEDAQAKGLTLFWAHDLATFTGWVARHGT